MRVICWPADTGGCGHFRVIWPAQLLQAQGHDVRIQHPQHRDLRLSMDGERVMDVLDIDADVVVFQRLTHRWMAQAVPILRRKGVAVVVDVDDDLTSIHPRNPAYASMHPRNEYAPQTGSSSPSRHSWKNLTYACSHATLVTVSTPALLETYARHGRGRVLHNYLPEIYYGVAHEDSDVIGWPAALASHPDDPSVMGGALARLCGQERPFHVVGDPTGVAEALGLTQAPTGHPEYIAVEQWPAAVARLGVGVAPLADTRFNVAKSWLKPLELAALGVPWVASPRPEYQRLHALGTGVLADRPRVWYRELKCLVENPSLRAERAQAGRAVAQGLQLTQHAWRWAEAWQDALTWQRAGPDRGLRVLA